MFDKTDGTHWRQRKWVTDSHTQTTAFPERFRLLGKRNLPGKHYQQRGMDNTIALLTERSPQPLTRLSGHFPEWPCCHSCQVFRLSLSREARCRLPLARLACTRLRPDAVCTRSSALTGNNRGLRFPRCHTFSSFPLFALPTGFLCPRARARRQSLSRPRKDLNRPFLSVISQIWQYNFFYRSC